MLLPAPLDAHNVPKSRANETLPKSPPSPRIPKAGDCVISAGIDVAGILAGLEHNRRLPGWVLLYMQHIPRITSEFSRKWFSNNSPSNPLVEIWPQS